MTNKSQNTDGRQTPKPGSDAFLAGYERVMPSRLNETEAYWKPTGSTAAVSADGANSPSAERSAENGPPLCNTGGPCANEVHLDWLRVSFPDALLEPITEYSCYLFGDSITEKKGLWFYEVRREWSNGVSLNFNTPAYDRYQAHCTLDVRGKVLCRFDGASLLDFIHQMNDFGAKGCRLDPRFDDFTKRVSIQEVRRVRDLGHYSPKGVKQYFESGMDEDMGRTVVFGRRGEDGSGLYRRYYDKDIESQGEIPCYRWEVEYSGEKAKEAWSALVGCSTVDELSRKLGGLVTGGIDFRNRDDDPQFCRCKRYDWWQSILDEIGNLPISISKRQTDIQRKKEWVEKNLVVLLAQIRLHVEAMGRSSGRYFRDLTDIGIQKMTKEQRDQALEHCAWAITKSEVA